MDSIPQVLKDFQDGYDLNQENFSNFKSFILHFIILSCTINILADLHLYLNPKSTENRISSGNAGILV